jgi:hypothetical protein
MHCATPLVPRLFRVRFWRYREAPIARQVALVILISPPLFDFGFENTTESLKIEQHVPSRE